MKHPTLTPPARTRFAALLIPALLIAPGLLNGQTVDWGTSVSTNPILHQSNGSEMSTVPGAFTWQLGWFDDGFTPTVANYDLWVANWNPVDTAYPIDNPFYVVSGHADDVGAAAAGKQAYVFAFNDLGLIGQQGGEALLYRQNGFLMPGVPNQDTFDIDDNPGDAADDNFTVIWGRVDRAINSAGGVITGGGVFTEPLADSTASTFEAQSATWPVPEPSVAAIGMLGALLLFRRSRRENPSRGTGERAGRTGKMHLPAACCLAAFLMASLQASADYPAELGNKNPLLYYRLDEAVAPPAPDPATNLGSLGSAADGLYTGSFSRPVAGVIPGNGAVAFSNPTLNANLYNGGMSVSNLASLNPTGAFTIEFWAKPTNNTAALLSPVNSMSFTAGRSGYLFYQNGATWQFRMGNTTSTTATALDGGVVTANAWQHVVATYTGGATGTITLFVNGAQVSTTTAANFEPNTTAPFRIGATTAPNREFDGAVDEVAFYNAALSPARIAAHYTSATTTPAGYSAEVLNDVPLAYWRLDEPAPPPPVTAVNQGTLGAPANGVFVDGNSAATTDGIRPPDYPGLEAGNNGVSLDGLAGHVRIPATGSLSGTGLASVTEATFICWIKRNGPQGGFKGILSQRAATPNISNGIFLEADDTLKYTWNSEAGTYNFATGLTPPDGEWAMAAVVVRADRADICLASVSGGFQVVTRTAAHAASNFTAGSFAVGRDVDLAGRFFKGAVDEAAVFTRALSVEELRSLFETAKGTAPYLVTDPPVLAPSGTLYAGDSFTLTAEASGALPLSYQWRRGGVDVGAPSASPVFSITNATTADTGNYDVVVSNLAGNPVTSSPVTVLINDPVVPTITATPEPRSVFTGGSAVFKVAATGPGTLTYQWKKGASDLVDGPNVSGATTPTLRLTNLTSADADDYIVAVHNSVGDTFSGAALTVVVPTPGTYSDPVVTAGPLSYWRLGEAASATIALDGSGANDGAYVTTTTGVTGALPNDADTAAQFDGSASYVNIPAYTATSLQSVAEATYLCWIKRSGPQGEFTGLLSQRFGAAGISNGLFLEADDTLKYAWNGAAATYNFGSGLTPPDGEWAMVAVVVRADRATLYMGTAANGLQSAINVVAHAPSNFTVGSYAIGRDANFGGRFFGGSIDEAVIYTRALSTAEISAIFNSGGLPSAFHTWISTNYPSITAPDDGPDADFDKDGITNLQEFALGGDPASPVNGGLTRSGIENVGGDNYLTLTFACRAGASFTGAGPATANHSGVTYLVRASTDLAAFTQGVTEVTPAIPGALPVSPPDGYFYRTFRLTQPVSAQPRAFIQVRLTP